MLAKAFIPQPAVVLLDEPTASLDPDIAQEVRTFVMQQKEERGISILFTSHNMHEVTQVCDRVLVLQKGVIIADSTPLELASSVADIKVNLTIVDGMKRTVEFVQQKGFYYEVVEREIEIEIDEHKIAELLSGLAQLGVSYSQISINKPTLEDYFMNLVKRARGKQ
jgi:ABC-2 type transport system ATP-binding protein